MKDDAEDYPVSYLLYVSGTLVAIALVAMVAYVFLSFTHAELLLQPGAPVRRGKPWHFSEVRGPPWNGFIRLN